MNIPKSVIISGIPYAVIIEPDSTLEKALGGQILYEHQTITINDFGNETTKVVFLHECVHGMLHALGIADQDETHIRGLGMQLYQLIKDNPEMFS